MYDSCFQMTLIGSDVVLISKQWKSEKVQDRSQNEDLREATINDDTIPKQIISDGTQEQDMIALACKTLRGETRRGIVDPNKLKIVCKIFLILF